MKHLKNKKIIVPIALLMLAFGSFSFVNDFFEVSKNLDIFSSAFREVNLYYVDESKPGDLMKKAIDGMLNSLDPYTDYIPESDIEDYRFMTTGQYGGIGATVRKYGMYVVIAEPYEGFPAFKNDLRAGDKLLSIDGKDLKGKSTDEVSKLLKGQPGTEVTITIERTLEKSPLIKKVTREEIKIKSVPYYALLKDSVGYIFLTQFTESASRDVKDALIDLQKKGMKSLVFDLRGNPGGLLNESVNICNFFVDKGTEVVKTKGKVKEWEKTYRALNSALDKNIPLALLVNAGSASASEIVSGCIQDLDRGVIVGQKTYGKGLVQATRQLSYNCKLKVTVAKYYIPSGRCIQAIDYSNRNEAGAAGRIFDSLTKPFNTVNNRLVRDGGGIMPDYKMPVKQYSKITQSLVTKNYIFDFATNYRLKHDSIASPTAFKLSDTDYVDFTEFLKGKEYDYTTNTEKVLKELKETAEEEEYYLSGKEEDEQLKLKLQRNKKDDLDKFKEEIKEILESEIISRFYFQKGRIQNNLIKDKDLEKAIFILQNQNLYSSVLNGTCADCENKRAKKKKG